MESQNLKQRLKSITRATFSDLALDVFRFQYYNNSIYRQFVDLLKVSPMDVKYVEQIPFLPIQFFKTHQVVSSSLLPSKIYESSGTTGMVPSRHYVFDESFYFDVAKVIFENQYGPLSQYHILALLPNYLQKGNSSLVAMVNHFMNFTGNESGFYLDELDKLQSKVKELINRGERFVLWGVTYALLDFAEDFSVDIGQNLVMETGGMKGRKKELVKDEVHAFLQEHLGVKNVNSEYGMTELFSQAYSLGNGRYEPGFSMKVLIREVNDPLSYTTEGRRGGINIVDLANIDTCSFIATEDLGHLNADGTFEILGRFDSSDARGCNLMVSF
jgi:hypothetical protein